MSILIPVRGRLLAVEPKVSKNGNSYIIILIEKPAKVDDLGYAVGMPTIYKISVMSGRITMEELERLIGSNVEASSWLNSNKFFSSRENKEDYITSLSLARISPYNNVQNPRPSGGSFSGSQANNPNDNGSGDSVDLFNDDLPF